MDYLLKASAVLIIFFLCYKLFLQKDTFFKENRWFLMLGMLVALLLPNLVIPKYVEYVPETIGSFVLEVPNTVNEVNNIDPTITLETILTGIYFAGLLIFALKFLFEILSLSQLISTSEITKEGRYKFTLVKEHIAPFSFFNWIVINPKQFLPKELDLIVKHEKVHVRQLHSLDLIGAQILCVVLWFNPFVWLYKKSLNQNLEFIADSDTQQTTACEKSYQELLLKTSIKGHNIAFVNNFYNSLIKKRIVMLQKNKSNKYSKYKLALVLPLLAIFLMSFNTKTIYVEKEARPTSDNYTVIDQLMEPNYIFTNSEKVANVTSSVSKSVNTIKASNSESRTKPSAIITPTEVVMISKNATDANLEDIKSQLKKEGITIKFKGVKRNRNGEITAIKISAKSDNSEVKYSANDDDGIDDITIKFSDNNIYIGNGKKTNKDVFVMRNAKVVSGSNKSNNVYVYSSDSGNDLKIKNYKDYLFIKDGETISVEELEKIYPELVKSKRIATFDIIKGDKAVEVYGKDAKNGVVVITTGEPNESELFFDSDDNGATIWINKDGKKQKIKSTTGTSKIIIRSDDDDQEDVNVWITKDGKKQKVKTDKSAKIYITTDDDDKEKEVVIVESIPKKNVIVIGEPKDSEEDVEEIIIEGEGTNVWTTDEKVIVKKIGKDKKSFFFINSDNTDGEDPLFIMDGKEISRKEMLKYNPDNIESISILKDESATKKYGEKGKNGVVEIITKKEKE